MAAKWTWLLTDQFNATVSFLKRATSKQIVYQRNSYAEASFTLLHTDPDTEKILELLLVTPAGSLPQIPRLQAWRTPSGGGTPVCRFCGNWAPSQEVLNETENISLVFRSPFATFLGDGSTRGRFTDAIGLVGPTSKIAAAMLRLYGSADLGAYSTDPALDFYAAGGGYAGLDIGVLDDGGTSVSQLPLYSYNNVGQAIIDLTNVDGSFDFYERYDPDTAPGGSTRMAYFDTYTGTSFGLDRTAKSRFEYGRGTLNNVTEAQRTLDYPVNDIVVIGANGAIGTASDSTSLSSYGQWSKNVSETSISDPTALGTIAQAYLRPYPVTTIAFTPEMGRKNCPKPFDDYDLGDIVTFQGRRSSFIQPQTPLQINGFTIAVDDDSGLETAVISDPLDPDGTSTARAQIIGEVLSNNITEDEIDQAIADEFSVFDTGSDG